MAEYSILIGGKAGFGIDKASSIIGRIFNAVGYHIYIYRDYPSLIRGGHTFSIIRACRDKIGAHYNKVDFILALNQDTINLHKERLKGGTVVIYDSDLVKLEGLPATVKTVGIPMGKIIKEENANEIMRNSCIIGSLCRAAGLNWDILDAVFRKEIAREIEPNLKVARRGYDSSGELIKIKPLAQESFPILSGNQAIGLGLIRAGLKTYIAYPMTPTSPILHFLAEVSEDFSLKVIHPENEIGVILMALGASYAGEKAAVGTSGGGFCLMTEGLSMAGMAELPIVIIVGQRPGPSTGLPTYSTQSDLHFVLNAGQGEFPRFIVAPGDAEEAYYWSAVAMNITWKYQLPSIILSDKNLGEGVFNFDINSIKDINEENPGAWDRKGPYKRYLNTESGISPLAFAPDKEAVIKVNSYEHDESGITTEDPQLTVSMQEKRLRKEKYLSEEIGKYSAVNIYGNKKAPVALLCWGSNKGLCVETARNLGLKVIQPVVLSPFPAQQFKKAIEGVDKIICVENNATGQLERLIKFYGFDVDERILKYDGRPFSLDELEEKIKGII